MSLYDLSSGTIARRFNFGVFGQRYICDDDGIWNNSLDDLGLSYGYTSRRHDEDSGLMYFRARYYDPTIGEFISQDSLEYVDGMSMYRGYFAVLGVDPFGTEFVFDPSWHGSSGCFDYCYSSGGDYEACLEFCGLTFPEEFPGNVDVPPNWPHEIDWGEVVPSIPETCRNADEDDDCRCAATGLSLIHI